MKQTIISRDKISSGSWLELLNIKWRDAKGRHRTWEAAARTQGRGAVMIIAVIKQTDEIILVKQFRPPAGRILVELPAGLIDDGEPPEVTAERELLEETGYHGSVVCVSPPGFSSAGISGETITTVTMEIDAENFNGKIPESSQEDSEDIETVLIKRCNLRTYLKDEFSKGNGIDAKLWSYAAAL
ncbi:NUDIX hydrolase [Lentisphaerota bacterium ZTH]|nr:NUDIX hydrolase [Lentisphaerota bacterium]WET07049.1 NUDIX hydrolase [Lentisphaerota bacterium ZTH]